MIEAFIVHDNCPTKVDWPILVNLRLDPFERTGLFNGKDNGSLGYYNWFAYEFWRFVFVQQEVGP
jgi:arylsulfatase